MDGIYNMQCGTKIINVGCNMEYKEVKLGFAIGSIWYWNIKKLNWDLSLEVFDIGKAKNFGKNIISEFYYLSNIKATYIIYNSNPK